ncbi:hypothetical protein V8F06_012085 [Rhypophila decipiens]
MITHVQLNNHYHLKTIANLLGAGSEIMTLTGAGITNAGIPVAIDADPTKTHRFIRKLRDANKLVRHYTQNIDCLEEKAGLSTDSRKGLESAECVLLRGYLHNFRRTNCPATSRQEEGDREMERDCFEPRVALPSLHQDI